IFAPQKEYMTSVDTTINKIPLHISHLKHSDDEEWPDIVYSFLVDIGGKRILHNAGSSGYFTDEYKKIRYDTMNIDIAVLYHHFLSDTSAPGKQIIDLYLKPAFLLIGHKDDHSNDWMDSLGEVYTNDYPNLGIMTRSGDTWEF
ncbi:MAG: hypothetical protein MI922_02640, partial [Bacteroidales bacterium]|nr:hypothetical protein [Bacteroidales bacterium]